MTAISAYNGAEELAATQLDWQFEDNRFYRLLLIGAFIWLVLAIIIPALKVEMPTRQQLEQVPAQLAKVMLEQRKTPQLEPDPEPKPEPKPESKPEPKPEPVAAEKTPTAKQDIAKARQEAQQTGLLALQDDLAAMRQSFNGNKNQAKVKTTGQQQAAQVQRDLVSNQAKQQFAQQQAVTATADVAQTKLAEVGNTQLSAQQIEGLADQEAVRGIAASQADDDTESAVTKGRSEARIRQTLEANKTSLYALYSRALRKNPLLQGKVVFEFVISPDGSITDVKVVQSELNDPKLERQLSLRLQSVNFGAEPVAVTRSQWTVEFLPS
ncbi:AgmX/PglI C-terminal domain-containing protein [Rheinheimera sp. WS51]|uniref:AgmX/PglI C-terminal domain-containing protein n=1 Tax=Rheinheimera sp. WS51 TaxID=3425886 RepID=UPI003D8EB094